MRDVLPELLAWWRAGADTVLATVVGAWQSAPRQPGAAMLLGPDGTVVGSVSGGCVESDVHASAEQVMADGRPSLQRYGVSDDDAFSVGLTCGGTLHVLLQRVNRDAFPELDQVAAAVDDQRPVAVATVVSHPDGDRVGARLVVDQERATGTVGDPLADAALVSDVRTLLAAGRDELVTCGPGGQPGQDVQVFVECLVPRPRLLVFGSTSFAAALAAAGTFAGYRSTVCDARPLFATRARLPGADEVVVEWPHRYLQAEVQAGRIDARDAICVLTHDPKFDLPLLEIALTMPVTCFVGAMGSRGTHRERVAELRARGLRSTDVQRLSSPVGLDLGASTPEETAISIMAEIIATRRGGTGERLAAGRGTIHHQDPGTRLPDLYGPADRLARARG